MKVRAALIATAVVVNVAGLAIVNGVAQSRTEQAQADAVAGCERNNVLRRELHGFLRDAAETRREAGTPLDSRAAEKYDARADALEQAARDDGVAIGPHSAEIDCEEAFAP